MGYEMTKVLANSDVDYWRQMPAKESHQSAIFIGSAQGEKVRGLLGEAKTGDAVKIVLNRSNLIHVLTAHYEAKDQFFSSRNLGQWTITVEYLKQCLEQILAVFRTEEEVFIASVNRQTSAQNCRAWIKGLQPELKREDGTCGISIFDFLFSGDTLHFIRDDAWLVHIEIIPKVVTSVLGGSEKGLLRVGDVFSGKGNETYEVIGVEPHAYRIRFNKTGKIRTTPKTVVAAWYKFYKEHPFVDYDIEKKGTVEHKTNVPIREASSRALRDQYLNTSTEDDSFEHAYDGMLGNIARWLLDNPREEEEDPQNDAQLPTADSLTVALKMFAEKRAVDKPSGWDSYDAWTHGVRTDFVAVDESFLANPAFDYLAYIRKFAISWQVANTKFASHSDDEKHAVLKFLKAQKDAPKPASWYIDETNRLVVGGSQVKGMSPKAVLYFMSELHPEEFAAWTEPTYEQLAYLGLHKGATPNDLTIETYEDCKSKQQQIVARMKELGIGKASDDATDPDYRTVNEFLWWLGQDDNKNLIKEKIMAKEFKNVSKKAKTGERKLSKAVENDEMMQRLMAALRTKPFAILAGHSGTGKSQLVRRLAYMTCNDEGLLDERNDYNAPGNYCMVQVKPNWHDSTDLLGYYTEMNGGKYHTTSFVEFICKAYAYPETPFFVCLDEMNLAPVEQYFAEFLSAIESYSETTKCTDRLITEKASPEEICGETKLTESLEEVKKHGLTIPRNLFVVGTVNVDETTCQFSRKVLDRAMTILMTAVSFKSMTEPNDPSKEECLDPAGIRFFLERPTQTALVQGQMDRLDEVQKQIGDTPFAIAYRFANEYALYQAAYQILMDKGVGSDGKPDLNDAESQKTALDHVVLMKLLPRIHGERRVVEGIFKGRKVKGQDGDRDLQGLSAKVPDGLSAEMMDKILARPDEYLTFWP